MITVGIDEVGRGCWAGPLVAAAVILGEPLPGLTDSKLLNREQRERLSHVIYDQALAVGIGWVSSQYIDEHGLTAAVREAMNLALRQITIPFDEVIIDGHLNYLKELPKTRALVRADASQPAVSAASIVAKVARDNYMRSLNGEAGDYGFDRHVGYGTALHIERLRQHGVGPIHRRSFKPIRALLQ